MKYSQLKKGKWYYNPAVADFLESWVFPTQVTSGGAEWIIAINNTGERDDYYGIKLTIEDLPKDTVEDSLEDTNLATDTNLQRLIELIFELPSESEL